MQIKRRLFSRIETLEQITLKTIHADESRFVAKGTQPEGTFLLQISYRDAGGCEKLFTWSLDGTIEIEQSPDGRFFLVCIPARPIAVVPK